MEETIRATVVELILWPEKGGEPERVSLARAIPGIGLEGDQKRGRQRQVTLLAQEAWDAATRELGVEIPPHRRRANVVLRGLDLEHTIGRRIRLGPVLLEILGETEPCELMDRVHPDLQTALRPHCRAGVFGAVLEGGVVGVGDPVSVEAGSSGE